MTGPRKGAEALVLGVGNILWADEGFGVRCAEAFVATYETPEAVSVVDGGTQGLALVNDLAEARRILIFDAVDFDAAPGELVVARGDDVPRFVAGKKVSLHQTSMMEILAVAELMADSAPEDITLVGCQPAELEDYGGGLTALVSAQVEAAINTAADELRAWGVAVQRRHSAPADAAPLMPTEVMRSAYEVGRPTAAAACRIGDERVLVRAGSVGRAD